MTTNRQDATHNHQAARDRLQRTQERRSAQPPKEHTYHVAYALPDDERRHTQTIKATSLRGAMKQLPPTAHSIKLVRVSA